MAGSTETGPGAGPDSGKPLDFIRAIVTDDLDLFRRMRAGEFEDGSDTLRAKIDMRWWPCLTVRRGFPAEELPDSG